jgi:hypothetical protein
MRINLVGYVDLKAIQVTKPEDVANEFDLVDVGLTQTILERNEINGRIPVYFSPDCQGVFIGVPRANEVDIS